MFASTEDITFNAVTKTLTRLTNSPYKATYGLDDGGDRRISMKVEHTVPTSASGTGESHMIRIDIDNYDVDGVYERRDSVWFVMKTTDAVQNTAELDYAAQSLVDFLTDANVDKLLAREA